MILTKCAACAAPLAYDHKKRCSRCKTRYCNEACQRQHWERGGHDALCRRIKRGGGAEQYHAEREFTVAVAVACVACADDIEHLESFGEDREETIRAAINCAITLVNLERFEEARPLLRKTIPVARRVFGASHDHTLTTRSIYAATFYKDPGATLADLREAVTTLEETEPTARHVLGGAHPRVAQMQRDLRNARAASAPVKRRRRKVE